MVEVPRSKSACFLRVWVGKGKGKIHKLFHKEPRYEEILPKLDRVGYASLHYREERVLEPLNLEITLVWECEVPKI